MYDKIFFKIFQNFSKKLKHRMDGWMEPEATLHIIIIIIT